LYNIFSFKFHAYAVLLLAYLVYYTKIGRHTLFDASNTNRVCGRRVDCIRSPGNWEESRRLGHIPSPVVKDATRQHTVPAQRTHTHAQLGLHP